jgi:RecA/RadA recombinase
MNLDADTGGGFPGGTICQIFGPEGAGKNLLANHLMAQAQRANGMHSNILYVSFGYMPDVPFMRLCGVKVHKTDVELEQMGIDPETATLEQRGEQIGNLIFINITDNTLAHEQPSEVIFESVRTLLASCRFQMIVIDEMASGETKDDVAKGLEEAPKVATWANLVTQFTKKVYTALRHVDEEGNPNATLIAVLQPVRANLDTNTSKFQKYVQPSGHALKHAKAIDIEVSFAGVLRKGDEKIGKKIKYKVIKGKFGVSEGAEGELQFIFFDRQGNGGIDPVPILANMAKVAGTVISRGAFHYILDYDERIEGGLDPGVIGVLRNSPELVTELTAATLKALQTGEVG